MFVKVSDPETKSGNTATTSGVSANLDAVSPLTAPNKDIKESSFVEFKKSSKHGEDPSKSSALEQKVKSIVEQKLVSVADIKKHSGVAESKKSSGVAESKKSSGVSNIPTPH
jgi:hypothetical protein|tara:strand:+ start:1177 stop:1512 length:336 start_codon:yes stop_codon:yes gene_type:complete